MNLPAKIDFSVIPVIDVARELLGQENMDRSNGAEKHFPDHAGLYVNIQKNKWWSHGNATGGDALNLICFLKKCDPSAGISWLRSRGYTRGQQTPPPPRRVVCTYDYVDEDGVVHHHVDRYEPKDFRPWREIDGERLNGIAAGLYERAGPGAQWWRVKDRPRSGYETREFPAVRPLLYRQPELSQSDASRWVLIPGGEKDVDNLRAQGLIATTNSGGEGNWSPEFAQYFKARRVLLLCDNDQQGEKHQEVVGAALQGIAAEIRVVRFPELKQGGDVSDLIEQRRKDGLDDAAIKQELIKRFEDAPAWKSKPSPPSPTSTSEPETPAWPTMSDAAYHGLPGDIVNTISPHSEADPVAILIQVLVAVGNVIGRSSYYQVESDRHHPNLFAVLVGASSKARKGTSWGRVRAVIKIADPRWADERTKGGLSSGEGFIYEVRDPVRKWNAKEQTEETVDPGVTDKRLTVIEPEFAGALAVMERHGNTLSQLLRKAWDGDKLCTLTKNSPLAATGAHISTIGHITEAELRARLTRTDAANGFANRFLFALVKRSKELPFGGDLTDSDILFLGEKLQKVIRQLPEVNQVTMTDAAKKAWAAVYSKLSADKPGLLGAVIARAEAQVIRIAMIYALIDGWQQIEVVHLRAGLAVWDYCEASAKLIFGNTLGDPVADEILGALKRAGEEGLTRTHVRSLFGGHQSSDSVGTALGMLLSKNLVRMEGRVTGGRPVEVWHAQKAQ